MRQFKRCFAVLVGLLLAAGAVFLHIKYAWPPGLAAMSKSERDMMILEPAAEACAIFFIILRRASAIVAYRLGALGRGEELIHDTQGNIPLTEIMAAVLVIMFRGVVRLYPGPITAADYAMMAAAFVYFCKSVHELVSRRRTSQP